MYLECLKNIWCQLTLKEIKKYKTFYNFKIITIECVKKNTILVTLNIVHHINLIS